MLTIMMFLGLGNLFGGIGSFANGLFGVNTDPPADPPTLGAVYGTAFDLPNSNVVELPPNLPTTINPISASQSSNPLNNFFNFLNGGSQTSSVSGGIFGSIFGSNFINSASSNQP